jgi:hypothetical protein
MQKIRQGLNVDMKSIVKTEFNSTPGKTPQSAQLTFPNS